MTASPAILVACALFLAGGTSHAADMKPPPAPPEIDCAMVRQVVAEHGKAKATILARQHGATWAQIARAARCLRG